jgi:hypothetical protein
MEYRPDKAEDIDKITHLFYPVIFMMGFVMMVFGA